jgi:pSer/pThr/pTyr-binding forkhead associated (FHA) protein
MPFPPGIKPPKPAKQKRGKAVSPVAPIPVQVIGPVLMIMTGPRTGERIPLQNGFTIGKAPTSHLVLDDGYTSSQHAQLGVDPLGVVRLYDRNSTNGTYVNGVRVTEVVLDHGMSVRIGSIELRYLAQ